MHLTNSINGFIADGDLSTATDRLVLLMEQAPSDVELLELSRNLSARLRSRCMDLAHNKATDGSAEAFECEELLRRVIALNGEGIYG